MVKRRVVQKGASVARDVAEDAGRKLSGGIKRHTPKKPLVSDWGWKGGKPDEITGGMYEKELNKHYTPAGITDPRQEQKIRSLNQRVIDQIHAGGDSIYPKGAFAVTSRPDPSSYDIKHYIYAKMKDYQTLEMADIPREWTGKVLKALGGSIRVPNNVGTTSYDRLKYAQMISDAMRPMTNPERELFLRLVPNWQGSIDDLVATVQVLY